MKHILVVDDDHDSCELLREIFSAQGWHVDTALTPAQAFSLAEKEKIEATEEDLAKHFDKLALELKQPADKIRAAFRRQDSLESLKGRLRQDKALAFLLSKANFQ